VRGPDLDYLDRLAVNGTSPLHRASPLARVLGALLTVLGAVLADGPLRLAALGALLLGLGAYAGARPERLLLRALAPLPFLAALFLLHAETPFSRLGLLALRATVAALAMVLLLATTPFGDVLRVLAPVVPREGIAAGAVLYRSVFTLLRAAGHLAEAGRLRGARVAPGALVGGLLLHAFERTENVACAMHVRGVDVPDPDAADVFRPRRADLLPLGTGLLALFLGMTGG